MSRNRTPTASASTQEPNAAELKRRAAEDAAHDAACKDPAIIAAAGITNGMPAHEQRARLLKAAGFIISE